MKPNLDVRLRGYQALRPSRQVIFLDKPSYFRRKFNAGKYLVKNQSFKNGSRLFSFKCYFILVCMYICETSCGWTKWSALLWPFSCLCTRFMSLCPPQGVRTQPLNTTSHLYRKQAQNWVELEVAPYAVDKKLRIWDFVILNVLSAVHRYKLFLSKYV